MSTLRIRILRTSVGSTITGPNSKAASGRRTGSSSTLCAPDETAITVSRVIAAVDFKARGEIGERGVSACWRTNRGRRSARHPTARWPPR